MLVAIKRFDGEYRFLSNFYPCTVVYRGLSYPSAEHAYQASKTDDPIMKERIRNVLDAATAKRLGLRLKMHRKPADWDRVRVGIMTEIVWLKFSTNRELGDRLCQTGRAYLEEGNHWSDTFWGYCRGKGANHLGAILMATRARLGGHGVPAGGRPPGGYTGVLRGRGGFNRGIREGFGL